MAGTDRAKGYNFKVYFDVLSMSFSRISGLEKSIEVENFSEGGMNSRAYSLVAPVMAEKTMTFERGVSRQVSITSILGPGCTIGKEVSIFLLDDAGRPVRAYFLAGCTIKKITWGTLDASSSQVLVESMEVLYNSVDIVHMQIS